jgi:DNA (cytosine-5)-methyltransferase 1
MRFYEFFSGAGMARVGFGPNARCLFANDFDPLKCAAYTDHFGGAELREEDIRTLSAADLPECADVAWASSPCVDLSTAGRRAGLDGPQSSVAFAFLWLMAGLRTEGRAPKMIVIENVEGLVSSNGGRDLAALVSLIAAIGYRVGALVIDAKLFLPQSRARLFVIAIRNDVTLPGFVVKSGPQPCWHPTGLERALAHVSPETRRQWVWWMLPLPAPRTSTLADVIEADPKDVRWDSAATTARFLAMMSETNRAKVAAAVAAARTSGQPIVGAFCQRTRYHKNGEEIQRAEIRFDGLTGCLRTAKGGSSHQRLLFIDGANIRSRLVSPREGARLMGLPENYELPTRFGNAMKLIGDGVAVPVVEHFTRYLIMPILGVMTRPPAPAAVSPCPEHDRPWRAIERLTVQGRPLSLERTHV